MRNVIRKLFGFAAELTAMEYNLYACKKQLEDYQAYSAERIQDLRDANKTLTEYVASIKSHSNSSPQAVNKTRESWPRQKKRLEEASLAKAQEEYWLKKGGSYVDQSNSERESVEA